MSTTTITAVSTDQLINDLLVQQRAIARAEDKAEGIKAELIDRLGVDGKYEGDAVKVAIVQSVTPVLDFDALEATASRGFFYKVTKRTVDMTAVKAMMTLGKVPAEVQEVMTERVSKPSVRLTHKVRK